MKRMGSGRLAIGGVACALLAGSACDRSQSSKDVDTDEITALFRATADGSGETEVRARLRIPGDSIVDLVYVNLNSDDRMVAKRTHPITLEEVSQRMREHHDSGDTSYDASFEIEDEDTLFEIELDRSETDHASAEDSSVTLPAPIELEWVSDSIAMTPAPEPFSRSSATPYYLVWDPFGAPDFEPGDVLGFTVTGDCIRIFQGVIDWPGGEEALQLTGVLQDREPPHDGESCELRAEFTLTRTGEVDAAFADGTFLGEQVRVLKLQSTP